MFLLAYSVRLRRLLSCVQRSATTATKRSQFSPHTRDSCTEASVFRMVAGVSEHFVQFLPCGGDHGFPERVPLLWEPTCHACLMYDGGLWYAPTCRLLLSSSLSFHGAFRAVCWLVGIALCCRLRVTSWPQPDFLCHLCAAGLSVGFTAILFLRCVERADHHAFDCACRLRVGLLRSVGVQDRQRRRDDPLLYPRLAVCSFMRLTCPVERDNPGLGKLGWGLACMLVSRSTWCTLVWPLCLLAGSSLSWCSPSSTSSSSCS